MGRESDNALALMSYTDARLTSLTVQVYAAAKYRPTHNQ